jgi:hypothetical protein
VFNRPALRQYVESLLFVERLAKAFSKDLRPRGDLVGSQENVDLMAQYLPLDNFKAIYVVDLCKSLCEQSRRKVAAKGWSNVHVVEGDACIFQPPDSMATLVTFSYSLSSAFSADLGVFFSFGSGVRAG